MKTNYERSTEVETCLLTSKYASEIQDPDLDRQQMSSKFGRDSHPRLVHADLWQPPK
uniref:Uncharacterized protein n=1 Tax=Arion vulgaris TaxID=1028688 RepID=A0A0B6YW44_9EUPU